MAQDPLQPTSDDPDAALRTALAGETPPPPAGGPLVTGETIERTPPSATAMAVFLLALGGAIEGYAVSQAGGPEPGRSESLIWAVVGVAAVITAWALRSRRWWSVSGIISISLVGIATGTYAALSLLGGRYDDANRLDLIGVVAVGVSGIILLGLLSSAWPWLVSRPRPIPLPRAGRSPDQPADAGA